MPQKMNRPAPFLPYEIATMATLNHLACMLKRIESSKENLFLKRSQLYVQEWGRHWCSEISGNHEEVASDQENSVFTHSCMAKKVRGKGEKAR